ncbi:hypothetical protein BD779DRAFT_1541018 [Infundibulicybe gibba]|nr:hypothetical protein BD779DRAFT_1541018 [Infundibulicybe gibba]
MSESEPRASYPQDIVAIFHASFHPTQGNIVDWSLKASDDLSLENVEFSVLPSGLHLVEQDVVYFNKEGHSGVCVFRKRKTSEHGHRGFRLSSLGILLAKSQRPRPWRHIRALKELISIIYSRLEVSGILQPNEEDWEPARVFFNERKVRRADLGGAGDWNGWSEELDNQEFDVPGDHPTFHLSHLLRILGPSALTLYKHVLCRRRILIYTLPPVEAACILCQVAADMCYQDQATTSTVSSSSSQTHPGRRLKGKSKEPINVLGMVTLTDLSRLEAEGRHGRGWIACTTDAIFLDKPSYYDLLIDLTTSTPNKTTRPTFYTTKTVTPQPGASRSPTHRLSTIRFAWSDIKLWNELERILQLDSDNPSSHTCCGPSANSELMAKSKSITAWTDAWRVYEDVCIICAGLWLGSWRGNSTMSYSTANGAENWGGVRLEGDDDLTLGHVRNVGASDTISLAPSTNKPMKRSSAMSWSSGRETTLSPSITPKGKERQTSTSLVAEEEREHHDGQLLTTLSLLQTFHANTSFQLSILDHSCHVIVKRGWKDLLSVIFGYG